MYKLRPYNNYREVKAKRLSSTKKSFNGHTDIMQMAEELLNNNTALEVASNESLSHRVYPMLSKKNTFYKKSSGIKPVLEKSLNRNKGTNSSKSIGKFPNLDISASILDISSDHSFEHRMFSTNKKKSRSPLK